MIFMLKYAFTYIFFTAHTALGCGECLIGMLFDRKPDKWLYRACVAAYVIVKVRKENAMNERESQQADCISNKTL